MRPSRARDIATAFGAGFIVGAVATGLSVAAVMSNPSTLPLTLDLPTGVQPVSTDKPAEDDPDWDAERDGNGIVGPDWDCTTMGDLICQAPAADAPAGDPFDCERTWWGSWSCVMTVPAADETVVLR